jgi:DNA-directed RNA polymerase specialized sigma24 family protein
MVIAVAAHIVGDTATAEDIASEVFERLARQTDDVREQGCVGCARRRTGRR